MLLSRLARSLGSTRSLCERASQLERVAAARQVGRRAFVATTSQWQQGQPAPRAAIMVVGNEVLSGKIQDTNSVWLGATPCAHPSPRRVTLPFVDDGKQRRPSRRPSHNSDFGAAGIFSCQILSVPAARLLYSRGVDLIRMEVIPDDITVISETAKKLSDLVGPEGFVFSSGGIGPTHDDMTYDARTPPLHSFARAERSLPPATAGATIQTHTSRCARARRAYRASPRRSGSSSPSTRRRCVVGSADQRHSATAQTPRE